MNIAARFSFLRRPLKLILITVLTALLSASSQIFNLQARLDGMVVNHAMNSAAYIGTVYSRMQKYPMIKEIPESILAMLETSETVNAVSISHIYSAKAESLTRVADGFGNVESLNMKLFLEGIVDSQPALVPSGFGMMETFNLKITTNWGGIWTGSGIEVRIFRDKSINAPILKEGDHVFLAGRYNSSPTGDVTGMILYDPEVLDDLKMVTDSAIWNHPILILPRGISAEESATMIEHFLQDTGLWKSIGLMEQITDFFRLTWWQTCLCC